MAWHLKGTYLESCNCEVLCPCQFLGSPTEGECTALVAWHIDQGEDGATSLDGLNVAMAVHSPGPMATSKWHAVLYLDERASEPQKQSLTNIFGGRSGGHPATLASFVGDVLGISSTAIEYQTDGKRRSVSLHGIGATEIEAIEGQGGGEVTLSGHPFTIATGQTHVAVYGCETSRMHQAA